MSIQLEAPRREVKPRSLFRFLTWAGGLKPHPDLRVILDGKYGWMVRASGMSLDDARLACIEQAFLQDSEERDSEPSINDLLELIASEARGHKVYRIHELARGLQSSGHDLAERERTNRSAARTRARYTMTKDQYKILRKKLGLTHKQLAEKLGISIRAEFRNESGDAEIGETVAKLLWMLAQYGIPKEF